MSRCPATLVVLCSLPLLGLPAAAQAPRAVAASDGVTFADLLEQIDAELGQVPVHKYRADYDAFVVRHKIADPPPSLLTDYVRLRMLNEAVRDGGIFRLRWDITNQEPSSKRIWAQWFIQPVAQAFGAASAVAECDELSGLLGLFARRLEIGRVGLFYPTWNHTIAAWQPALPGNRRTTLVLIPTTQIFLTCNDSFDTTSFPTTRKSIEVYPLRDMRDTDLVPRPRADWLIGELHAYVKASPELLSLVRLRRALAMGSSVGVCNEVRRKLASTVASHLDADDRAALEHLGVAELFRSTLTAEDVLRMLGQTVE